MMGRGVAEEGGDSLEISLERQVPLFVPRLGYVCAQFSQSSPWSHRYPPALPMFLSLPAITS